MRIEVWSTTVRGQGSWHWHFRSKGRITADAEVFPTKQHAIRAAQAVVNSICKKIGAPLPIFTQKEEKDGLIVVNWCA